LNVSRYIQDRINQIPEGTTFRYQELEIPAENYNAAAKALERYIRQELIKRISTGVFYKPVKSVFGELKPKEEELIKPYLFKNGRRIAYVTGNSLYNRLGLTTQVSKNIKVASREARVTTNIGSIKVKPVKSYVDVTDSNYTYLELLDIMKDIKQIPDSNISDTISFLKKKLITFKKEEIEKIIETALKYPPRVRALLGALLEINRISDNTERLKKSINPLTEYKLGVRNTIGETSLKWNLL